MSRRSVIALVTAAVLGLVGVSVLAVLVADGDRRVGAISQLEASPGYWALQVDGQTVGRLASVETCGPYGEVVESLSAGSHGGSTLDRQLTRVRYRNCVVRFGLGMGLPLFTWINRTLDRQPLKKNVVLVGFDGNNDAQVGLRLMNALIKKVVFPEVEAETTAPYLITLTIQPETVVRDEPFNASAPTGTGVIPAAFDSLRLDGQNVANVNKFGPVVATQETVDQQVTTATGELKIVSTPRRLVYEPVQVEAVRSPNQINRLANWFESFVVEGQRSNNAEKDAELRIRDDDFNSRIEFSFEGVGIFDSSDSADLIWRRYSLYIEDLSMQFFPIVTPAPAPPPPTQTQTQTQTQTTETETTETETTETETTETETETEPPPDDPQPLAAPVEPRATLNENGGVTLEWGPVDEAEGYVILMSREPGGDYAEVARSEGPTVVVEKLESDPPYYFVVRAIRGETESANSEEVVVKG